MSDREKILRYYRTSGEDQLAVKLLDAADAVLRNRKYKVVEFLDPFGYTIAETIIAHYDRLQLITNGGYLGAERQKAAFVHKDFLGKEEFMISALLVSWDSRYYHISHRDILGAFMGLGIKRETIGDIIMLGDSSQIVVDSSMASYIMQNLTSVGSATVTIKEISLDEIRPREEKIKEIRTTVASLRVDVIAAAGFGVSRSKMADEIVADKVKINWQQAKSSSHLIKEGDVISMRGRGRIEVSEIFGQTKKGRISILLKRVI
ncbi:YlmH family RNA-binding protein [Dendrosporobacter sp. 1207_IL3150]|uniref:YlmH family RNA-binding protein n=1 Tax=Dendrosporobacter sp. 1207_IL3150 TaxID=3084054 RepID=UPI002FD8FC82